jgi:DNA-binding CsgD family transcriptional regulator
MASRSDLRSARATSRSDRAAPGDGRRAATELRWRDAYDALSELDGQSPLAAEDLEILAIAGYLCGHAEEARQARLRAYQLYMNSGNARGAARCATIIGFQELDAGEIAEATGCLPATMSSCAAWVAHASQLLSRVPDGAEHGLLLIPTAYEQLVMEGDPHHAAETAARATAIGRRFGDADLLALSLMLQGRAMVKSLRIPEGTALLDNAVTVIGTGEVSVPVAGIVLTSAIDASGEAFDIGRFEEWTRTLAAWSEHQQGMVAFQSRSLVHLAVLSQLRGRWDEAIDLTERASQEPIAAADPSAGAAAAYALGEILRLRGEVADAQVAYHEAHRLGMDPQPGLALLRLAQGDVKAGMAAIGRVVLETTGPLDRARLLPGQVEILLASGDLATAADAAGELVNVALAHGSPALHARAQQARGATLLAQGDAAAALSALRDAARVWHRFNLPYDEARCRTLIARSCVMLGDADAAALEVDLARTMFASLGARPDLAQVESVPVTARPKSTYELTRRELEVLRLLATGLTNREIAHELTVSVRTVDTHVGSILAKLAVSSRAAATAFAHRHHLV